MPVQCVAHLVKNYALAAHGAQALEVQLSDVVNGQVGHRQRGMPGYPSHRGEKKRNKIVAVLQVSTLTRVGVALVPSVRTLANRLRTATSTPRQR